MVDYNLNKQDNESEYEYKLRIYRLKTLDLIDITWKDISDLFESELNQLKDSSTWRKECKKYFESGAFNSEPVNNEPEDFIREIKKLKMQMTDERVQNNAYLRRISREETIKEIAKECAQIIGAQKSLLPAEPQELKYAGYNEAILQISDWHYGIDINNYWNTFNPDICKARVNTLLDETICFCYTFGVQKLHMVNLGDMISGRIHNIIRLENRIDAMTQIMEVSEILAEFISKLTNEGIEVNYYDCLDNHSRMEPIKADSMDKESLCRIIPWYLLARLQDNKLFKIHSNEFGDDILTFYVLDGKYKVAGVHGHKERAGKLIEGIILLTKNHYDLILSAHYHHFEGKEQNETLVISNGSLMGTDDYSKDFKLNSKASQNLILVNENDVADYIHRVKLN